jgi:hypothetical protein
VEGSDILRTIEEAAVGEPAVEQLQKGYNAYDECSQISKRFN